MKKERTRKDREEIARYAFKAIEYRRERIPRFGGPPLTPREIIDRLIDEDPGLAERENKRTPLQRIREEVRRESTQEKLKLR